MKVKHLPLLLLFLVLVVAVIYFYFGKAYLKRNSVGQQNTSETATNSGRENLSFKKTPHYLGNAPSHNATLPGAPTNIVIDFDFDLGKGSSIKIVKDGIDYGRGETTIDSSGLSLRRYIDEGSPDGLYQVTYNACWPDGSCHEGNFQYKIDRSALLKFVDLKGKKEIVIPIENYSFAPRDISVSRGTKITWQNRDRLSHTINSDPHPGHTYFPALNSRILNYNDSFSVVFNEPGVYLYHCSVHPEMSGVIVVE